MPLDPKVEAARPPARRMSGREMAWLLFLRLGSTSLFLFAGLNIAQSNAALWAKTVAIGPFVLFIYSFAKDNVSEDH